MLEVFLRSIVSYIVIIFIVRLMGKRMGARLTATEMAVMLMFGAIVSSSMQIPERGVIEGTFVLLVVVLLQRIVTTWTTRSTKIEDHVLGTMLLLIKDGVLEKQNLAKENISRMELFSLLRENQVTQLGEVKRLYLETTGSFSLYKNKQPKPGVSVFPEDDPAVHQLHQLVEGNTVCYDCGTLYPDGSLPGHCRHCGGNHFAIPVKIKA